MSLGLFMFNNNPICEGKVWRYQRTNQKCILKKGTQCNDQKEKDKNYTENWRWSNTNPTKKNQKNQKKNKKKPNNKKRVETHVKKVASIFNDILLLRCKKSSYRICINNIKYQQTFNSISGRRPWLILIVLFRPFGLLGLTTFILFGFPIIQLERTWCRLFQNHVVRTNFVIYVFYFL